MITAASRATGTAATSSSASSITAIVALADLPGVRSAYHPVHPLPSEAPAPAQDPGLPTNTICRVLPLSTRLSIRFIPPGAVGIRGPGQDGQGWPLLPPSGDLGLVDVVRGQHRVGADDEVEHVGKPVRGVDTPVRAGLKAQAKAGGGRLERVDRRLGGVVWRAGNAEFLLIPQVHARLIADLDRGGQVTEEPAAFLDDRVLGVPGQIRG